MSRDNDKKSSNLYDVASSSFVANEIEKTQINKFHTRGGTGFAAEEANSLNDLLGGKNVEKVGVGNELNGPDRIVDGVSIQTKYYDNARSTLNSSFDESGKFKYSGQILEVPSDQYEECLSRMREKIVQGKVPGVTDPSEAESIIKKGDVTYKQARNIARSGNIDSLWFDAKNQCVTTTYAFAISFTVNFARQKWSGKDTSSALKESVSLAFQSGASSFITGVVTAQIVRTRTAAIGIVVARDGVRAVAQTQIGKSAVQSLAQASLGKAVYGAAATNHVAKLLRTNTVTAVVATAVVSAPDFYRAAFKGSVSWGQFSKNLTVNGAGVAGGTGGWIAGAAGGVALGSVVPIIGNVAGGFIGGIIGALAGGAAASAASKYILDGLIEDDAKEMIEILPDALQVIADDYLLSQDETNDLVVVVKNKVDAEFLRDMYSAGDRRQFVYGRFDSDCAEIVSRRARITLPEPSDVQFLLNKIEEECLSANGDYNVGESESPRVAHYDSKVDDDESDGIIVFGCSLETGYVEIDISQHPAVEESSVVGFDHQIKGTGIYAFVVLKGNAAPSDALRSDIISLVKSAGGPTKTPDYIQWAYDLPRNKSGKVVRSLLRKIAQNELGDLRMYDGIVNGFLLESLVVGRLNKS